MRDVAREAGVSVATVSRVINKTVYVDQDTEEKVMEAIKKLNYKPNAVARSLSIKKSNIIALILPSINNPFFPKLVKAVEDVAQSKGYKVFLCNTDGDRERLVEYLDSLSQSYVDGIIINSESFKEDDLRELKTNNIPVITTDRTLPSNLLSSISVNNRYGGQIATEHLIEIGCTQIGHLRGPKDVITADERYMGYRDTVKDFEWFAPSWVTTVNFSVDDGYKGMKELFKKHPEIDGIFAANDLVAVGALKAASEMGYKVPEDLAIVGFDGIDITKLMIPRITTIQQPIYQIGRLAAEEILRLINNPDAPVKKHELEVELVQRESTMR